MLTRLLAIAVTALPMAGGVARAVEVRELQPDWTKLTMEVCVEPPMRREKSTHDELFNTFDGHEGELRAARVLGPVGLHYIGMAAMKLPAITSTPPCW
jgi:hypothetical protein